MSTTMVLVASPLPFKSPLFNLPVFYFAFFPSTLLSLFGFQARTLLASPIAFACLLACLPARFGLIDWLANRVRLHPLIPDRCDSKFPPSSPLCSDGRILCILFIFLFAVLSLLFTNLSIAKMALLLPERDCIYF
jgi:hypothetical protein